MPDFQHRDCTLVYDDHPGPAERAPVLLLHGLGSSARDWEYQLPALLGRYRLLVPDLRGHGRSGKRAAATAWPASPMTARRCSTGSAAARCTWSASAWAG